MQEFTLIPVFAEFLDGFNIEDSIEVGAASDLAVTCSTCLDEVIVLTTDLSLREVVTAVVDHRCDVE